MNGQGTNTRAAPVPAHRRGPPRPGFIPLQAWGFEPHAWAPSSGRQVHEEAAGPMELNLVGGRSWPLRDQGMAPTCTAYATMACLELHNAGPTGAIRHLSSSFAYYFMALSAKAAEQTGQGAVLMEEPSGYTRFEDAQAVLAEMGYCTDFDWPDKNTGEPPAGVRAAAAKNVTHVEVRAYPPGTERPSGLARVVYQELAAGRPVAVGMAAYVRNAPGRLDNWTRSFTNGVVGIPGPGDIVDAQSGHAVCIVGFTTLDKRSASVEEGYFVFRNSFGLRYATAPITGWGSGYGLLPACLIDEAAWGLLLVTNAQPTASEQPARAGQTPVGSAEPSHEADPREPA